MTALGWDVYNESTRIIDSSSTKYFDYILFGKKEKESVGFIYSFLYIIKEKWKKKKSI